MFPLETLPPPPEIRVGEWFTSGLFCLQSKHPACECFLTKFFLQGRVVSTSPNPQAGGPPLVGCPRLLIQYIRSYPPYRRPFLRPQPEDAPCRGDGDPLHGTNVVYKYKTHILCSIIRFENVKVGHIMFPALDES